MKIAVLGAGAMGGIFAMGLHRGGQDVLIIDAWKPHVEVVRTTGLQITGYYAGQSVEWRDVIPAIHIEELDQIKHKLDMVFLAVKGYDTRRCAELILPVLAEDGLVISVQNGINEPIIAEIIGPERTIGCDAMVAAQTWEPGHINITMGGKPGAPDWVIGEYQGGITPRVERLAKLIRDNVGGCEVSDHIMDDVWTKWVGNCGGNLLAAITSWDNRELGLRHTARLRWALQAEAITVCEQLGVKLGQFLGVGGEVLTKEDIEQAAQGMRPDLEEQIQEQAKNMVIVTPASTLHDALRGTPMEVETLNGYVVKRAEDLEIPVPYNRALVRVARLVDEHKLRPYPANLALFQEYIQEELSAARN